MTKAGKQPSINQSIKARISKLQNEIERQYRIKERQNSTLQSRRSLTVAKKNFDSTAKQVIKSFKTFGSIGNVACLVPPIKGN